MRKRDRLREGRKGDERKEVREYTGKVEERGKTKKRERERERERDVQLVQTECTFNAVRPPGS